MDEILGFLINVLSNSDKTFRIQELAESFLEEVLLVNVDSIDYSSKLKAAENRIVSIARKENLKFYSDGLQEPFIIKGSSNNLICKAKGFNILLNSLCENSENCNEFSNRIGKEILKLLGCKESNIFITPDTGDDGIDYWGLLKLGNVISNRETHLLVVGQVKKYSGNIPVEDLREFVGAVNTALGSGFFGEDVNANTPHMLQFVATGEISNAGKKVADINKINIISKRHLIQMGLLKDDNTINEEKTK